MRGCEGAIRPSPTCSSDGLLKKPSVSTADVRSEISRVVTPAQVTVGAAAGPAGGRSKNVA